MSDAAGPSDPANAVDPSSVEKRLEEHFTSADLEVPCLLLLQSLYPEAAVEHRGGPGEHGADIVVTWEDPLCASGLDSDLSWRAVYQVKDWRGVAHSTSAVDQLSRAIEHYGSDYTVRGAFLLTLCESEAPDFGEYRLRRRAEVGVPLEFVGKQKLLKLFREYALSRV